MRAGAIQEQSSKQQVERHAKLNVRISLALALSAGALGAAARQPRTKATAASKSLPAAE